MRRPTAQRKKRSLLSPHGTNLQVISGRLNNLAAAEAVVDFIIEQAERLTQHSMMGKIMKPGGPRELILSRYPYNIIYRIARAKVRIVRVIHQSRQFP